MEPKFYVGNFILNIGIPYIIISPIKDNDVVTFERIKIIDYFEKQPYFSMDKIRYYRKDFFKKEDLFKAEIDACKGDIFEEIRKKLIDKFKEKYFNINLDFSEKEASILFHLVDKYKDLLGQIIEKTENEKLMKYITHCYYHPKKRY